MTISLVTAHKPDPVLPLRLGLPLPGLACQPSTVWSRFSEQHHLTNRNHRRSVRRVVDVLVARLPVRLNVEPCPIPKRVSHKTWPQHTVRRQPVPVLLIQAKLQAYSLFPNRLDHVLSTSIACRPVERRRLNQSHLRDPVLRDGSRQGLNALSSVAPQPAPAGRS